MDRFIAVRIDTELFVEGETPSTELLHFIVDTTPGSGSPLAAGRVTAAYVDFIVNALNASVV